MDQINWFCLILSKAWNQQVTITTATCSFMSNFLDKKLIMSLMSSKSLRLSMFDIKQNQMGWLIILPSLLLFLKLSSSLPIIWSRSHLNRTWLSFELFMRSSCLDEEDQVGDTTANIMRFDIFGKFKTTTTTTTPCGVKYNILWGKNWAIVITDNVLVYSYLAFSLGRLHIIFSTFIYRQITLCNIRCVFNDDDHVIVIWHDVCQVE